MRGRSYVLLSLIYSCMHLAHIGLSCVLLLQGWSPMSIRERARLAEIAASGIVLRTFRDQSRQDGTYSAEFRLQHVYKGHDLLTNVTKSVAAGNVYNISNFGRKTECLADVESDLRYLLFLTVFDERLSAQYDDIFGAASLFDEADQEEILSYLGWDQWGQWSACTSECGGGRQTRSRECRQSNVSECVGVGSEEKTCNLFSCHESRDLLTYMGVRDFPLGVSRSSNRSSGYVITQQAKLSVPLSRVFANLPRKFSLLMRVRLPSKRTKGYFFVISDSQGKQQLAVYLGKRLKFQYLGNNYGFRVDILENTWHSIAVSVNENFVTLYADCDTVIRRRLRGQAEFLGPDLVMSIGPYYSQYGSPFEGEVEQLVISSEPLVASQQCGLVVLSPNSFNGTSEVTSAYNNTTVPADVTSYAHLACSVWIRVVSLVPMQHNLRTRAADQGTVLPPRHGAELCPRCPTAYPNKTM
ncbi:uncharacterized protein LOC131930741 [Physella acuta]|uniref:uncharacterized protein LOC131930741 n=1 Tax=Physella acuta TaxID=109671 RepID=UPI0027DE8C56|nr:uncharacterized protein LOC131930741 [Physella acuta]